MLKTNKFTYDEKLKIMNIDGDIAFKTKKQYLKAENIEYDFLNKKGFIIDAFGSLNLQKLSKILNYKTEENLNENFVEDLEIKM